jgi:hypothetical protein
MIARNMMRVIKELTNALFTCGYDRLQTASIAATKA